MRGRELLGFLAGAAVAPAAAVGSLVRRGRVLHPSGVVYRAQVVPVAAGDAAQEVAARLAGPALVRLSSGLRKGGAERHPDLLGASIRFRHDSAVSPMPGSGDQDMLFATARSALTLPIALLTTELTSFLWDDYYALGLFESAELGLSQWRLVTPRLASGGLSRDAALEKAVSVGAAVFELQARDARLGARYESIARIQLVERVEIDQAALRFSPFRAGRGIVPRGFIHAMRVLPYAASQLARPRHE